MNQTQPLAGRVALVSGASRGIGRAIAVELARVGASVAVNYAHSEAQAGEVVAEIEASGGRAMALQADVSRFEECRRLVEAATDALGPIDVLVNNAGVNRDHRVHRMTPEEWRDVLATNLDAAFYLTHLVSAGMRERRFGRIVNISSLLGRLGSVGQANYAASKAGLVALTKSVALELAPFDVTVNAVSPGYVETDLFNSAPPEFKASMLAQIPLGRFGTAAEVAALVRFVVTEAPWMTGADVQLNGGQGM